MARSSFLSSMNFGGVSALDLQNWNGNGGSPLFNWLTQVDAAMKTDTGHQHDGADSRAVKMGSTSQLATIDGAGAVRGAVAVPARIDHEHGITWGTTSQLVTGTGVATRGTANAFVRVDHIHANQLATTSQLATVDGAGAVRGALAYGARGDHEHAVTWGTTSQMAAAGVAHANARGSGNAFARADHVHNRDRTTEKYLTIYDPTPANADQYFGGGTTQHQWHPDHTVVIQAFRVQSQASTTVAGLGVYLDLNGFAAGFTVLDTNAGTTAQRYCPRGQGLTTVGHDAWLGRRFSAAGTTAQRTLNAANGLYVANAGVPAADHLTLTVIYRDA